MKRDIKSIDDVEVKKEELPEPVKRGRGRPKKVKEETPKKSIGRPKSKTDIKVRRMLYGISFFGKMLGLTDEELDKKKLEFINNYKNSNINNSVIDDYKTDSDVESDTEKKTDKKVVNITV